MNVLVSFIELIVAIILGTLYFSGAWVPGEVAIKVAVIYYLVSTVLGLLTSVSKD